MSESIIQNALKISRRGKKPFYLVSIHRHHFARYDFNDGSYIFTDGGHEYLHLHRGGGAPKGYKVEDYTLYANSHPSRIRARLLWGNRGKNGDKLLEFKKIRDCSKNHLRAILRFHREHGITMHSLYEKVIRQELKTR